MHEHFSAPLTALGLSASLVFAAALSAHGGSYRPPGGTYRGPGDTVPGGAGPHTPRNPAGPATPGPSSPSAPAPGGPTTPGPSAPATPSGPPPNTGGGGAPAPAPGGPATPRGITLDEDFTSWQTWWEFNKDRFLNLKDAIHAPLAVTGSDEFYMGASRRVAASGTLAPSESDIQTTILPALHRALTGTDSKDIVSSCLMALAKIGRDHTGFAVLPLIQERLVTHDQEIRETAALAMGLTGMPAAIEPLTDLALDRPGGRKLIQRAAVDYRTRSFAIYGLALVAHRSDDLDLKRQVLTTVATILEKDDSRSGNVFVAAVLCAGLLHIEGDSAKAAALRGDAVRALDRYFDAELGVGAEFMQAHVPGAIAKLLGRGDTPLHRQFQQEYLDILQQRGGRKSANDRVRSAALALGQMADAKDVAVVDALAEHAWSGKDAQARYFAMIALGQIGGEASRTALLKILGKGNKAMDRPWAALALGIRAFHAAQRDPKAEVDVTVGRALLEQFHEVGNPAARPAFAIAIGLCRFTDAGEDLLDALQKYRSQEELAGYLCIGLALMDDRRAVPAIHEIVETSVRRPTLLRQAAIALGKMGDKQVAPVLMERLREKDANLAKLSAVASALGYIGDRRTIGPLQDMLHSTELTDLTRAFAAVALGMIADKERLPFNAKIAADINYRAAVETLTQTGTGVLDIL